MRIWAGLAVPLLAVLVAHLVTGMVEGIAMLAPALALLVPLLAGRYVGEQTIHRVRRSRMAPAARRRRAVPRALPRRVAATLVPRGGLLLASSLATRPPPLTD
ncbi:MAG: hypothetical protein JWP17_4065 [Solirubrobacterales bacterium]|nr:hypothetical protein [Solirubrobacterales bacterium]